MIVKCIGKEVRIVLGSIIKLLPTSFLTKIKICIELFYFVTSLKGGTKL